MKILILCEGRTELAFQACLRGFLQLRLRDKMPKLRFLSYDGALPKGEKLQKVVHYELHRRHDPADAVIALTDVYPAFADADQAKRSMTTWAGGEARFFPHVALHDFEAWLLPYWDRITELARKKSQPFGMHPEKVNHNKPPAHRLGRLFEAGKCRDSYSKPRDAKRILENADLMIAIQACPELKAFVNTILTLCDPTQVIA